MSRAGKAYLQVGLLLLFVLAGGIYLQQIAKETPRFALSLDFRSLRKLEYQRLVAQDSLAQYQDLDEIKGHLRASVLQNDSQEVAVDVKALPVAGYRLQIQGPSPQVFFLLPAGEHAEQFFAQSNPEKLKRISQENITLNGVDQGPFALFEWMGELDGE